MNFTDRYRILQNIIAQKGLDIDLYQELAKAESMINAIEQNKMMPPPVPEDIATDNTQPTVGRYDDL